MPRPLSRALLMLLLCVPAGAQTIRVNGAFTPTLGAPAVTGLGSPVALTPMTVTPLSSALSLAAAIASPGLAPVLALPAAAVPAIAFAPAPAAAKADFPAGFGPAKTPAAKFATPAQGWAKRFDFQSGARLFDGSRPITTETGEVLAAVAKGQGAVRLHLVNRAPLAASKGVPGTENLKGAELLDALTSIAARGHHARTYNETSDFMFSKADQVVVNGVKGVIDAYSGIFVPGTSKEGGDYPEPGDANGDGFPDKAGMNVEHTWPQSLFAKALPERSDIHHLMATFMHPNSIRGHMPFGIVTGNADYENKAGAKRGNGVFEPPDAVKGRVARGLLYFYTRHKGSRMFGRPATVFWNQQIELMMKWNREFPPDAFEARHNDLAQEWQGNRNPFIDDYLLADRVGAAAFRAGGASGPSGAGWRPMGRRAARR